MKTGKAIRAQAQEETASQTSVSLLSHIARLARVKKEWVQTRFLSHPASIGQQRVSRLLCSSLQYRRKDDTHPNLPLAGNSKEILLNLLTKPMLLSPNTSRFKSQPAWIEIVTSPLVGSVHDGYVNCSDSVFSHLCHGHNSTYNIYNNKIIVRIGYNLFKIFTISISQL